MRLGARAVASRRVRRRRQTCARFSKDSRSVRIMTVEGLDVYAGTGTIDWTQGREPRAAASRSSRRRKATTTRRRRSRRTGRMHSPPASSAAPITSSTARSTASRRRMRSSPTSPRPAACRSATCRRCSTSSARPRRCEANAQSELRAHRRLGLGRHRDAQPAHLRLARHRANRDRPRADHLQLSVVVCGCRGDRRRG